MILAYLALVAEGAWYVVFMPLYAGGHVFLSHNVAGIVVGILVSLAMAQLVRPVKMGIPQMYGHRLVGYALGFRKGHVLCHYHRV